MEGATLCSSILSACGKVPRDCIPARAFPCTSGGSEVIPLRPRARRDDLPLLSVWRLTPTLKLPPEEFSPTEWSEVERAHPIIDQLRTMKHRIGPADGERVRTLWRLIHTLRTEVAGGDPRLAGMVRVMERMYGSALSSYLIDGFIPFVVKIPDLQSLKGISDSEQDEVKKTLMDTFGGVYLVFSSPAAYLRWVGRIPRELHGFNEVAYEGLPQRFRVDLDGERSKILSLGIPPSRVLDLTLQGITHAFDTCYPRPPSPPAVAGGAEESAPEGFDPEREVVICNSSTPHYSAEPMAEGEKMSFHLVVPGYRFRDPNGFCKLYTALIGWITKGEESPIDGADAGAPPSPEKAGIWRDVLDAGVSCSMRHNLRLAGCHKLLSTRTKRIDTEGATFEDSLLGFYHLSGSGDAEIDGNIQLGGEPEEGDRDRPEYLTADSYPGWAVREMSEMLERKYPGEFDTYSPREVRIGLCYPRRRTTFQCPVCKAYHGNMEAILAARGRDVRFYCWRWAAHGATPGEGKKAPSVSIGTLRQPAWMLSVRTTFNPRDRDVCPDLPNSQKVELETMEEMDWDLEDGEALLVRSGMGTGKSKALLRHILHGGYLEPIRSDPSTTLSLAAVRDMATAAAMTLTGARDTSTATATAPAGAGEDGEEARYRAVKTVLRISFRQTDTDELVHKWRKAGVPEEDYRDIHDDGTSEIHLERHKCTTIQYESLHHLRTKAPVDLLILDEAESILNQEENPVLVRTQKRTLCMAMFEYLIKSSVRVIALDAYLGVRTLHLIRRYRPTVRSIENLFRSGDGHPVEVMDSRMMYIRVLDSLEAGRRVVLPVMSKSLADAIHRRLTREFPEKKIRKYTSDSSTADRAEFENATEAWRELDVLIYTGTLLAGCSFEIKGHFQDLFMFASSGAGDERSAIQMMGRVRDLDYRALSFDRSGAAHRWPESVDAIGMVMKRKNDVAMKIVSGMTERSALEVYAEWEKRQRELGFHVPPRPSGGCPGSSSGSTSSTPATEASEEDVERILDGTASESSEGSEDGETLTTSTSAPARAPRSDKDELVAEDVARLLFGERIVYSPELGFSFTESFGYWMRLESLAERYRSRNRFIQRLIQMLIYYGYPIQLATEEILGKRVDKMTREVIRADRLAVKEDRAKAVAGSEDLSTETLEDFSRGAKERTPEQKLAVEKGLLRERLRVEKEEVTPDVVLAHSGHGDAARQRRREKLTCVKGRTISQTRKDLEVVYGASYRAAAARGERLTVGDDFLMIDATLDILSAAGFNLDVGGDLTSLKPIPKSSLSKRLPLISAAMGAPIKTEESEDKSESKPESRGSREKNKQRAAVMTHVMGTNTGRLKGVEGWSETKVTGLLTSVLRSTFGLKVATGGKRGSMSLSIIPDTEEKMRTDTSRVSDDTTADATAGELREVLRVAAAAPPEPASVVKKRETEEEFINRKILSSGDFGGEAPSEIPKDLQRTIDRTMRKIERSAPSESVEAPEAPEDPKVREHRHSRNVEAKKPTDPVPRENILTKKEMSRFFMDDLRALGISGEDLSTVILGFTGAKEYARFRRMFLEEYPKLPEDLQRSLIEYHRGDVLAMHREEAMRSVVEGE